MIVTIDPEVVRVFGFWSGILALKLLAMAIATVRYRRKKEVVANVEDVAYMKEGKVSFDDPDVERVRRAHLNDLENILPWFISTCVWLSTGPSVWLATHLIRTFVIARVAHSVIYVIARKQPLRGIAFGVGFAITVYQTVSAVMYYL